MEGHYLCHCHPCLTIKRQVLAIDDPGLIHFLNPPKVKHFFHRFHSHLRAFDPGTAQPFFVNKEELSQAGAGLAKENPVRGTQGCNSQP